MRLSSRFLITWFSTACLLMSGCGGRADEATVDIAIDVPAADTEIQAAERVNVIATAGRPDSGFPTTARVRQVYQVVDNNLEEVLDQLRAAVEAEGWEMETVYEEGSWRTATREFDGRSFYFRTNASLPDENGDRTASLILEECGRGNSPCAEELP